MLGAFAEERFMENTIGRINASIASLRADAAHYRKLAEPRKAVNQEPIAEKLMELVAELEAQAAQLEAKT